MINLLLKIAKLSFCQVVGNNKFAKLESMQARVVGNRKLRYA